MNLSAIIDKALSLVFPPHCLFCGDIADNRYICKKCESLYKKIAFPVCSVCGFGKDECHCIKDMLFARVVAPFYYEGRARDDILKFKYYGKHSYGEYFAHCISKLVKAQYVGINFDAVTSVPAFYNNDDNFFDHAMYLGKAVADNIGLSFDASLLEKTAQRVKQHSLDFEQRFKNVNGLYKCSGNSQNYKTILLIDDISTTGATFMDCARVLKKFGVKNTYCAAVALTPKRILQ